MLRSPALTRNATPAAPPTFASRLEGGPNNIDLLRLAGAVGVLFVHSFVLTGVPDAEPSAALFGHATELGALAVGMFFVCSGFLVARSALRSRLREFVRARVLRLYPALVVVLVLQALVLGPALTEHGARAYLADPETWRALGRGLLLSPPLGLPGVFPDNPVPLAVNGSLWTLRFEAVAWAMLAVMAPLGLLGRRGTLALFALCAATVLQAATYGLTLLAIASDLTDFLAGAAMFAWRGAIPHRAWLAALAAALLLAGCYTAAAPLVICLTLPYLTLYLGFTRPLVRLPDDVSYGAYLYAFPIQQTLVALIGPAISPAISPWALTALALPPTLACAILSRRLVERPTQRRRRDATPI